MRMERVHAYLRGGIELRGMGVCTCMWHVGMCLDVRQVLCICVHSYATVHMGDCVWIVCVDGFVVNYVGVGNV